MAGLTFDAGALIALERHRPRICKVFAAAYATQSRISVPTVVITEWWRGRTDAREEILEAFNIEPISQELACIAGEALARVRGSTAIDALVMASAAQRGDVVYTSDFDDLTRLQTVFPSVRVLAV